MIIVEGCRNEDSDMTWYSNRNNMIHLIADVELTMIEGRAHNVTNALEVLKKTNATLLKMYGADGVYFANPNVSDYTNLAGSNILFIATAPLKHGGKTSFLGVRSDLQTAELDKFPAWGNEK
jgi:hypothetical protein